MANAELCKLAKAMCSVDLAESHWTQELPRLPVPDLWLTVSRYMGSLRAVLAPAETLERTLECQREKLTQNQIEANWRQYEASDQIVKQFMLNEGPQLQRDLKEYANKCQNWATEFWLQDMYLGNPLPLPVNSNPFFLFPRQSFSSSEQMLMFATRVIQFSVDFKYRIDQQTLRQDFGSGHAKAKALCMETYKNFFHSYRMPHEDMDRLLPQSRRSNHIVVASCNQFFILRLGQDPLENPYRRDTSKQLNESSIFDQLLRIYRVSREHARRQLATGRNGSGDGARRQAQIAKVGLFTTENRKTWARLHKRLSHCNGQTLGGGAAACELQNGQLSNSPNSNTESLRQIEDCLFVMCLDSLVDDAKLRQVSGQSLSEVEAANIILTGGGTALFTANRWFDKFLQIIVGRNGVCGINIEHSASEGITVTRFLTDFLDFLRANPPVAPTKAPQTGNNCQHKFDYQLDSITSPSYVEPQSPSALLSETDKITPLKWTLDKHLHEALQLAEAGANKLVENFSLNILSFEHFGRAFIKNQNLSPDAFVQLALQFTFYKLHGFLVSTYESASLRQFRLGRVDNIRANTCEAFFWIQKMLACKKESPANKSGQPALSFKSAEGAFIRAITKQVEILRYTIIGGGPDNHLLALRELAKIRYGQDELPDLFCDKSYKEFLNFRLSTSQLPNEAGITVGYGAVVPDGYGCSYNPCESRMIFCTSTFADCQETNSEKFNQTLEESLLEMQQLCIERTATQTTASTRT